MLFTVRTRYIASVQWIPWYRCILNTKHGYTMPISMVPTVGRSIERPTAIINENHCHVERSETSPWENGKNDESQRVSLNYWSRCFPSVSMTLRFVESIQRSRSITYPPQQTPPSRCATPGPARRSFPRARGAPPAQAARTRGRAGRRTLPAAAHPSAASASQHRHRRGPVARSAGARAARRG